MLGGFAADQYAARLPATVGDAANHSLGDTDVEFAANEIIQEKQRLSTLGQNIVDTHGHQIDAYCLMNTGRESNLKLGADTVGRGYKNGFTVAASLQIEKRAKTANAGQQSRQFGFLGNAADATHQLIARLDADTRSGVGHCSLFGQRIIVHSVLI